MKHSKHKLVAIYPDRKSVDSAYQMIQQEALDESRMRYLPPNAENVKSTIEDRTDKVRSTLINMSIIGLVIGVIVTVLAGAATAVLFPNVFDTAPAQTWLLFITYGAVAGGAVGALLGLRPRDNLITSTTQDAVNDGCYALVYQAHDREEILHVQNLMQRAKPIQIKRHA
ncbi:MAG: hypothetical protein HUJ29_03150 [Gammaproteobacteria bacterium]|nr:hypothetical protein [Gammaproteobacteria bacterium]